MKRVVLKFASLLLVLSLIVSGIIGCGGDKGNSENTSKGTAQATVTTVTPSELKVAVFDRGVQGQTPPDNNFYTKWIQENFGKPNNITMTFVTIPRAQELDKLNIWMASNTAPDVVFTYDLATVNNYVTAGGLTDLTENINKYGPNLKKYLGETILNYGVFGGKQYAVPSKRVLEGMIGSYIRKDWLDKLGLSVPKNFEEFYNFLKLVKEKDPGALGGKAIPFGFSMLTSQAAMMNAFMPKMTEEEYFTQSANAPSSKVAFRYLNKLYNEGLISPDFALDKDGKKLEQDISNGKVGFFNYNIGYPYNASPGLAAALKKNIPDAELIPCDPFTNYEGKTPKRIYNPNGWYVMVPKTSKAAVEAVKYLDWMSNPDVIYFLQNGKEGVNYTLKDGFPADLGAQGETKINSGNNGDYTLIVNGKDFGDLDKSVKAQSISYTGFEDMFIQNYMFSVKDGVYDPKFERPILAEGKYGKSLGTQGDSIMVKSMTAKPADFDKAYDTEVDIYMNSGGLEIQNEKKVAYKEMKGTK